MLAPAVLFVQVILALHILCVVAAFGTYFCMYAFRKPFDAVKFTGAGGRVTISTGQAGGAAVLRVTDTGIGIPAADLPRIFDRFWRGRQAAHTSGSGIGLSVAAELARAHGGELTASSTEDHGTEMTLTLPLA